MTDYHSIYLESCKLSENFLNQSIDLFQKHGEPKANQLVKYNSGHVEKDKFRLNTNNQNAQLNLSSQHTFNIFIALNWILPKNSDLKVQLKEQINARYPSHLDVKNAQVLKTLKQIFLCHFDLDIEPFQLEYKVGYPAIETQTGKNEDCLVISGQKSIRFQKFIENNWHSQNLLKFLFLVKILGSTGFDMTSTSKQIAITISSVENSKLEADHSNKITELLEKAEQFDENQREKSKYIKLLILKYRENKEKIEKIKNQMVTWQQKILEEKREEDSELFFEGPDHKNFSIIPEEIFNLTEKDIEELEDSLELLVSDINLEITNINERSESLMKSIDSHNKAIDKITDKLKTQKLLKIGQDGVDYKMVHRTLLDAVKNAKSSNES